MSSVLLSSIPSIRCPRCLRYDLDMTLEMVGDVIHIKSGVETHPEALDLLEILEIIENGLGPDYLKRISCLSSIIYHIIPPLTPPKATLDT